MKSYTEQHGFGRVARIPTPTPFPGLGDINSYLILPPPGGSRGPVLVDTGVSTSRAWDTLTKGLAEFGFAVEDLSLVLLTHAHPDHCGQADRIAQAAGCEVWIHEDASRTLARYGISVPPERAELIGAQLASFGVPRELQSTSMGSSSRSLRYFEPFAADRLLRDGERIALEGGFELEVVHTPGHCPEEVVFFEREHGLMFSGDHLLPHITPICLMNFPEARGADRVSSLLQYRASLEKAEALPARTTFPSHGPVIDDHRALIDSYRLHMAARTKKLVRLLEREPATVFALAQAMFPKAWTDQLFLVLSEVIGHLDLLLADGRAESERAGEELRFRLLPERRA